MKNLQVGVLGGGSWGTTVASLVSKNAHTILWARDKKTVQEINALRTNEKYLPRATLSSSLTATCEMREAVESADVIVMGVPSNFFREVLLEITPHLRPWVPIISLTKGLEAVTDLRMTQIIEEQLPGHPVGVLTGPNLAQEIIAGQAAASVLAMTDGSVLQTLQQVFNSGVFRVYTNDDVIGCELGGVLKNIIAIGVGMGVGLGAGDNTRAAIITRGLAEVTRLGVALGGRAGTFAGLAGMGDMLATCFSSKSRNHQVGIQLGKGRNIKEIIAQMVMVAEGVKSAPTVMALAKKHNVEMPISRDVLRVINGQSTAAKAFLGLVRHSAGAESDPG